MRLPDLRYKAKFLPLSALAPHNKHRYKPHKKIKEMEKILSDLKQMRLPGMWMIKDK